VLPFSLVAVSDAHFFLSHAINKANVKEKYEEVGDLGKVAQMCKSKQRTLGFGAKPKPLTVLQVLSIFREIAHIAGSQSQKLKVDLIKKMLVAAQNPIEAKYIIRGLQGKLRIGLAQSTVLTSLAHALAFTIPSTVQTFDTKSTGIGVAEEEIIDKNVQSYLDSSITIEKRLEAAANIVKQVYSEVPSYDALLDAALKVPLPRLHDACAFQPGIPVVPMLAKPTKSIQEVLSRLNGLKFTCEYKYDGERAQVHKTADGKLKVFSRNLLETSAKYPEVPIFVEEAAKGSNVESFVLDAEVVAYNPQTGKLVPFQVLSTRKKTEESAATAKVQVIVQAFDLMYFNGKSLLTKRLEERRAIMKAHFLPVEGKFQYATALDFVEDGDTMALEQFLDAAVKGQCEGLMVKTMDDVYEPSRRSLNWLKLKKDYLDGLGDSFDLVPIGAYHGRGKRTGVYGAYLLACYDEETEEFQSVCKIGTGFSDEDLQTLSAELNKHKIEGKSSQYNVTDQLECDVWFDAVQVWEVKAADLSKSSAHRGAVGKTGEPGRGIGLRFPRFERIRDDKKPDQATSSEQVLDIYYNQDAVKGQEQDEDDDGI
jgi:DNA ligase 1